MPTHAGADLDTAFIQISNDWGTYTAGRTGSFFDFWGSYGYGTKVLIDDNTQGSTNLFGVTFAGGNGFSFTIAAEDPMSNGRRDVPTFDDYEGQNSPDGVANIRVDQGWGGAQIMAAVHPIHDTNGFADSGGTQSTTLGFAVGAGLTLGIPGGWEFSAQGGYADGALGYITRDPGIGGARVTFAGLDGRRRGHSTAGDFVGPNSGNTTKAWNVRAGIQGPLISPDLTVWAEGSYTRYQCASGWCSW